MGKLRDLWVTQQKHYEKVKNATIELCNKTKQSAEMMGWLFEEIDPLFVRQVRVLTTEPWKDTGYIRRAILNLQFHRVRPAVIKSELTFQTKCTKFWTTSSSINSVEVGKRWGVV